MAVALGPVLPSSRASVAPAHAKASTCHPTCRALCGAVLLELRPMMKDASLNLNPAVLLANALSAFALNLVSWWFYAVLLKCPAVSGRLIVTKLLLASCLQSPRHWPA